MNLKLQIKGAMFALDLVCAMAWFTGFLTNIEWLNNMMAAICLTIAVKNFYAIWYWDEK